MKRKIKLPYTGKEVLISIQHMFAMFGATILVPLLTGINPAVALVTAGLGTLVFHLLTKCKVPVFLGSSFAFIPALQLIITENPTADTLRLAQGGIIVAGAVYCLLSLIVYFVGIERVRKVLPSVVTGPIIIVIAMSLAKNAIQDACFDLLNNAPVFNGISLLVAFITFAVVIVSMIFAKGFFKLVPILIGIAVGYAVSVILAACGLMSMEYRLVADAPWFNVPYVTDGFFALPKFGWASILAIAPIALVTFMEHIGDITTNSMVVGKDFMKDPGLHRTVLGDGIATMIAGFFGGPANTTYSENTGVLATTKNYNPKLLRLTAVFAIILGFFGKFGAILQTIPLPVRGGVEIILFGMIAAVGIRTLAESKLDFTVSRNLIIVGTILTTGIGFSIMGGITVGGFNISALFIATVLGVLLNLILPNKADRVNQESDVAEFEEKEFDIIGLAAKGLRKLFKKSVVTEVPRLPQSDNSSDQTSSDNVEKENAHE